MNTPAFLRRLGPDPHENGQQTSALRGCPDIWELADGDFAVIGIDMTAETSDRLPATAGCGPTSASCGFRARPLVLARRDIPERL